MENILPPLFTRIGLFGMSGYKAGNVTSVFFEITIRGRRRWFHGHCDLSDRQNPERMRAAIIAFETRAFDSMTRAEKLEAIWQLTDDHDKSLAGNANPVASLPEHRGKRTILVNSPAEGVVPKMLDDLTDEEISKKLAVLRGR